MSEQVIVYDSTGAAFECSLVAETFDVQRVEGWGNGQPGGCQLLSWKMDLDPRYRLPVFRRGALVESYQGFERRFAGKLFEVAQGSPWEFHARGLAHFGTYADALDDVGIPTSIPSAAVLEAIARGELPWADDAYSWLSDDPFSASDETVKFNKVATLLDAFAESESKRWGVWDDGLLVIDSDPGPTDAPDWIVVSSEPYVAESDEEYVTRLRGRYLSGVDTYDVETEVNAWAEDLMGIIRPESVDLTALGLMSSVRATEILRGKLDMLNARKGWTRPITLTRENLRTPEGVPGDPALVRSRHKIRVLNVVDDNGSVDLGAYADIVAAEVTYSDADRTAQVSPPGMVARDFGSVLADAVAPERPEFAEV